MPDDLSAYLPPTNPEGQTFTKVGELPYDPSTGFPKRNPKATLVTTWYGEPAIRYIDALGNIHITPMRLFLGLHGHKDLEGLAVIQSHDGAVLTQHKFSLLEKLVFPRESYTTDDDEDDEEDEDFGCSQPF